MADNLSISPPLTPLLQLAGNAQIFNADERCSAGRHRTVRKARVEHVIKEQIGGAAGRSHADGRKQNIAAGKAPLANVTAIAGEPVDEWQTLERIRRYIDSPPETSKVFTITPAIAAALLREYNLENRPKKPKAIARYADDMAARRWSLTGDTIKFSTEKRLRDGQNRLMACVRAAAPFCTYIVFGIDDAAFDRMDQGRNRSGSDVLAIAGYSNTAALSGAVRWAHLIETGRAKNRDTYAAPEVLRLLQERYGNLPDYLRQARSIYVTTKQPISLVTALLYLFHRANPAKAKDFANAWETGNKAPEFNAIDLMQKKIWGLQMNTSGRVHDVIRAALVIIAWNLFVAGRKGRKPDFEWHVGEPFPKIAS